MRNFKSGKHQDTQRDDDDEMLPVGERKTVASSKPAKHSVA